MDFRPFRNLHQVPGLSVFEGITTLKNPVFPQILLAITTILFQTPHAAPTFVFTSLPILIHLAETQSTSQYAKTTLGPLIAYLTADSFSTTRGLLTDPGQVIMGQAALSAGIACTSSAAVLAHRQAIRGEAFIEGNWDTTLDFGLLWAVAWLAFSWVSPFGRYGIPSPFPADIPSLVRAHRYIGTTGTDLLLGSAAYIAYNTGVDLCKGRLMIANGPNGEASDEPQTPSCTSTYSHQPANLATLPGSPRSASGSSSSARTGDSSSDSTRASRSTRATSTPPTSPDIGNSSIPIRSRQINKSAVALATLGLVSTAIPDPPLSTTSAPLVEQTPLSLGFVLPSGKARWQISDLIHEAQTIGNRANLLVFPESAYYATDATDRQRVIDRFVTEVCQQYGVWVQLGIDAPSDRAYASSSFLQRYLQRMPDKKINEVVLLGPRGVVGSYAKQKPIPYLESFPFHRGLMRVPVWEIPLPPPPGVNKTSWTPNIPHHRPIRISPLICLDTFHPDLLSSLDTPPDLFVVSASALNRPIARNIIGQAESIAITHSAPVMVVSGSRGRAGKGISVLLDSWGRVSHQQAGGRSFVVQVAIPYSEGKARPNAGGLGSGGVIGTGVVLLSISAVTRPRNRRKIQRLNDFPMRVFRYMAKSSDVTVPKNDISRRTKTYGAIDSTPPPRRSASMKRPQGVIYDRLIDVESVTGSEAWS